jgi:predicted nuclease of predicted toxin-antitoxin system
MILFDFNQIVISNLMEQIGSSKKPVEESLVRHMILNSIRSNIKKFRDYGEVIIACDSKHYWRRDVFPFYKGNRKKNRDSSGHDWASIFECMNKVRSELKEFAPYKVIDIEGAEADDIIGVLVQQYSEKEKVIILSSDKDFVQLQINPNVQQYSPSMKKFIKTDNAADQLKELIINGDKGDGVPNILSGDNFIVDGIRQKSITKVKLNEMMSMIIPLHGNDELKRNWARNKQLIDLSEIPQSLVKTIISRYEEVKPATKQQFMNYMIANRLVNLIEVLDEF